MSSSYIYVKISWRHEQTSETGQQIVSIPFTIGREKTNRIILDDRRISRTHAQISRQGDDLVLDDLNTRNGTQVNGEYIQSIAITPQMHIQIGSYVLELEPADAPSNDATIPVAPILSTFPPQWFRSAQIVSLRNILSQNEAHVEEVTYAALGGGLGSFTWVDHLRIFGVDASQIRVMGNEDKPYSKYKAFCEYSQIPGRERLRSDSGSTPDNIWGWPGYAVREFVDDMSHGRVGHALGVMCQIFNEPLVQTYTPISHKVFDSIDREMQRINYKAMWRKGRIDNIRLLDDGRYVIAYSARSANTSQPRRYLIAQYVHLAFGYPAIRLVDDLQQYRSSTGDSKKVVNAYEPHNHIYTHLERYGGRVLIRGRGIVASRIIQRLYEARRRNPAIQIIHLHRKPLERSAQYNLTRRRFEHHWEFQPFNWPKAAWGGTHRFTLEEATPEKRDELLKLWGGTTTADRIDWRDIIREGVQSDWYDVRFGTVQRVDQQDRHNIIVHTKYLKQDEPESNMRYDTIQCNYIIDATGLISDVKANPVLNDLVQCYNLQLNPQDRLNVTPDFDVVGLANNGSRGQGRVYASGVITLGGPAAAVDSFLGLQYAALRSVDQLVQLRAPGIRGLNGLRSISQFLRWAQGAQP